MMKKFNFSKIIYYGILSIIGLTICYLSFKNRDVFISAITHSTTLQDMSASSSLVNPYIDHMQLAPFFREFNENHAYIYLIKIQGHTFEEAENIMKNTEIYTRLEKNWTTLVNTFTLEETYHYLQDILSKSIEIIELQKDFITSQDTLLKAYVANHCVITDFKELNEIGQTISNFLKQYPLLYEKYYNLAVDEIIKSINIIKTDSKLFKEDISQENFVKYENILNYWDSSGFFNKIFPYYENELKNLNLQLVQYNTLLDLIENIKDTVPEDAPLPNNSVENFRKSLTKIPKQTNNFSLSVPVILAVCSGMTAVCYCAFINI